jgi:ferrous iron transport protein A
MRKDTNDLNRLIYILATAKVLGIPNVNIMEKPVTYLETGKNAVILRLEGGYLFRKKMGAMGIREQKTIRLVAKHPFHGPVVVEVDGREMTLGRRMAEHIIVGDPE